MVCAMLHRRAWIHDTGAQLHPYIPYYNRGRPCPVQCPVLRRYLVSVQVLRLRVCPPAWRSWRIGGLFGGCIVCAGMGQINGNAAVKLYKRFWCFGRIILHGRQKGRCKGLCVCFIRRQTKRKALHPSADARQKKNPAGLGRGSNYLIFSSRFARAAQSSCVSSSVKLYSVRSWSASALLHPPSYRAAALLETSFNMIFSSFQGFCPFFVVYHIASPINRTCKKFFALLGWGKAGLDLILCQR